jgi:hypothetical protein
VQAINDFYASRFADAEDAINSYLQTSGKKHEGAAHFFLGACLLSQAMLADPRDRDGVDALQQQSSQQFSFARRMHYEPLPTSVSPKILAQWSQAGDRK